LTVAVPTRKIGRWARGGCRWGKMAHGAGPPGEAGADAASTASWRAFALVAAALVLGQGSLSPVAAALPLYLADRGAASARAGVAEQPGDGDRPAGGPLALRARRGGRALPPGGELRRPRAGDRLPGAAVAAHDRPGARLRLRSELDAGAGGQCALRGLLRRDR